MMKNKIVFLVQYWLPIFAWMGLIYWLSSFHKLSVSSVSWQDFITRKFAHLTEYAILSVLFYRALSKNSRTPFYRCLVLSILLSAIYSLSDEYHQTLVSGRTGRWFDVGIDTSGAVIGGVISRFEVVRKIIGRIKLKGR